MLGDLIYQHTGKITSIRVLDTEKTKIEATVILLILDRILKITALLHNKRNHNC